MDLHVCARALILTFLSYRELLLSALQYPQDKNMGFERKNRGEIFGSHMKVFSTCHSAYASPHFC